MTTNQLLTGLVDDGVLFPPAALPMRTALARHVADLAAGSPVLTHRLLCPASRLDDLRRRDPGPLRLGLVMDMDEPPDVAGLNVDHVDVVLPARATRQAGSPQTFAPGRPGPTGVSPWEEDSAAPPGATLAAPYPGTPGVPVPVQLKRAGTTPAGDLLPLSARLLAPWAPASARLFVEVKSEMLPVRLAEGVGLKIRCGGTRAEDFPSTRELGAFVRYCVRNGVPFKAAAGLHHAVRHPDACFGVYRHGFLNLVLSVCAVVQDRDPVPVLESTDPAELVRIFRAVPGDVARRARELLVSYGSCNTTAPLADLAELGLTGAPARIVT
ncbi:hypothetical protein Misp01_70450 [Microtetraspora sp. NBRC 13810]|uniref:hypothetical protein n=1 Tax=Microtetraspora sp. NBRC 13810 TaxID=3030990 RepID=UPI00249FD18E|nr:hypothetical protein [Microtetraspora sp. NBRC 13810]GLW11917.1 hypothetical protein Misp01_70450 [Microtetraspora sp. NBRC 13810]